MRNVDGIDARSKQHKKKNECLSVFMSVYSPWWTWRPFAEAMEKVMPPRRGRHGAETAFGRCNTSVRWEHWSRSKCEATPMLCRYEGKQCSHPTLGKKREKKIMSLTKHLRYVFPQKQKSKLLISTWTWTRAELWWKAGGDQSIYKALSPRGLNSKSS